MSQLGLRLAALEREGLRRRLRAPEGVDLSSNDYLGLADDPGVRQALITALAAGVPHGSGGSRLLSGQHPAWTEVEALFAAWQGAPSALYLSTGYAANVGLLSALAGRGDVVVSDALNHASLIDGVRLSGAEREIVPHRDVAAVDAALARHPGQTAWVVVESVYSMDGDLADLHGLAEVCASRGAHLIVDEAHATGLYGEDGAGLVSAYGLRERVFATTHPCGKALGLSGCFVAGSEELTEWLVQRARSFVFSTAAGPYVAAGLAAAIGAVRSDPIRRKRPLELGARLRAALGGMDTAGSASQIVPVVCGEPHSALALQDGLAARGWHARAIRPPTVPVGTSRVRLVMRAGLSEAQVDQLARDVHAAH